VKRVLLCIGLLLCSETARAQDNENPKPARRLIFAGAITLSVAYAVPFAFALRWDEPELAIPVFGPLIDLHRCRDCLGSGPEKAVVTVLILDTLAQVTGATLLGMGLWRRHSAAIAPARVAGGFGMNLFGAF
jgi:hypothetical protein